MSMPANLDSRARNDLTDLSSDFGLVNTTGFLFGRDDEKQQNSAASPDAKQYLQMNTKDDKFPILVRREGELSASSAALDLALSQSPGPESQNNGWSTYRHRHAQQSLPTNTLRKGSQVDEYEVSRANGNVDTTPTKAMNNNRRSVEFNFSPYGSESKRSSFAGPSNGVNGMPKLQQSYSTNDVPTLKNTNGVNGVNGSGMRSHAEQHLHNHNANLGRIPTNGVAARHSRELSAGFKEQDVPFRPMQSGLHASAAPFGPAMPVPAPMTTSAADTIGSPAPMQYGAAAGPYYGYGMNMLSNAMNGLSMGQQIGSPALFNQNGVYPPVASTMSYYNPYTTYGPGGRMQDSQARVIQSRRMQNGMYTHQPDEPRLLSSNSEANRYMNYDLKTMPRAEIYTLCKDQHGCRFLQKKLEERNPEYLDIIFAETAPHVTELMTGKSTCTFL
jgi:hypothetical protein